MAPLFGTMTSPIMAHCDAESRSHPHHQSIEKAFSQIKASLKKTAARTKEALDQAIAIAIAIAIDLVNPQQARNYFKSCGYEANTV